MKSGRVKPTDSNRISVSGDRLPPELVRSILDLAMVRAVAHDFPGPLGSKKIIGIVGTVCGLAIWFR